MLVVQMHVLYTKGIAVQTCCDAVDSKSKKSTRPEHVHRLSQLVVSHGLKTVILEFVPIRGAS